jgi:hypothetical protein
MSRSPTIAALLISCMPWLVGCAPWTVVRQAAPSPFTAQTPLSHADLTFDGLMIGTRTEVQYLAERPSEAKQQLADQKAELQSAFVDGLDSRKGPLDLVGPEKIEQRYTINTNIEYLDPGVYNGFQTNPTELRARLKIADPQGKSIDELVISCVVGASVLMPTVKGRVAECARRLGGEAGSYLRQRTGAR